MPVRVAWACTWQYASVGGRCSLVSLTTKLSVDILGCYTMRNCIVQRVALQFATVLRT